MMKEQTLLDWRRPTFKFSYYPSAERERQLIDSHLEAWKKINTLLDHQAELEDEIAGLKDEIAGLQTAIEAEGLEP